MEASGGERGASNSRKRRAESSTEQSTEMKRSRSILPATMATGQNHETTEVGWFGADSENRSSIAVRGQKIVVAKPPQNKNKFGKQNIVLLFLLF